MKYNIAVIPGDGIGPEITEQSLKVFNAIAEVFGHQFSFKEGLMGAIAIDKTGSPLPEETIQICEESDAILFGAIGHPKYDDDPTAKVRPEQGLLKLRKSLGLYCNIRPVKAYDCLIEKSPLKESIIKGTDITIYRELTGGIYFGEKRISNDGQEAFDGCAYNVTEIERITHLAFKEALNRQKRLTLVDKANVLETSRLWRKTVDKVAEAYPEVELDKLFVDNAAMQLILNPKQFDVILTENMFGDIISDEASVIGGSIGLLASASIGEKTGLFEPIHGSFPQATGLNIANPLASILSVALLLNYLGLSEEASCIENAVDISLNDGVCTIDLNETSAYSTEQVGDYVVEQILKIKAKTKEFENIELGQSTII